MATSLTGMGGESTIVTRVSVLTLSSRLDRFSLFAIDNSSFEVPTSAIPTWCNGDDESFSGGNSTISVDSMSLVDEYSTVSMVGTSVNTGPFSVVSDMTAGVGMSTG